MKIFFICQEELWLSLGDAFRRAGFSAPSQARSGMGQQLAFRLGLYNQAAPIELVVVEATMAIDGVREFLENNYREIPVVEFSFQPETVSRFGWDWHPAETMRLLQQAATKAATAQ